MPSASVLAHLLISKSPEHQPLYRTQARIGRKGLCIPVSTLGEWIHRIGQAFLPLYEALKAHLLASGSIQVDETTIAVQDPARKAGVIAAAFECTAHRLRETWSLIANPDVGARAR